MHSGLFSIKLLVGGLREEMEVKAERRVELLQRKFQEKFRIHMVVFCLLVDSGFLRACGGGIALFLLLFLYPT